MTDRYNSLTVVLERDIRDDDAESILQAIRMIKGVLSVTGNVTNLEDHVAKESAKWELKKQIFELLK